MLCSQQMMFLVNSFILLSLMCVVQNSLLHDQNRCDTTKCGANSKCIFGCKPCEPTCSNLTPNCATVCRNVGTYCVCNEGYVKDLNGNCIKKNKCPSKTCKNMKCATNQTCTSGCAPTCRPSCKEPNPICTFICIMNGTNCACKDGYVVGPKGNCIKLKDCPPPTCRGASCGKNRTCTVCQPTCYPTCDKPNVPCTKICRRVGSKTFCPCSAGYFIGPKGNCVLAKDCRKKIDSCTSCRRNSIKVSQNGPQVKLSKVTHGSDGCYHIKASCRPNVPIFLVINGNETLLNSAVFKCSSKGKWIYSEKHKEIGPKPNVPINKLRCYLAE